MWNGYCDCIQHARFRDRDPSSVRSSRRINENQPDDLPRALLISLNRSRFRPGAKLPARLILTARSPKNCSAFLASDYPVQLIHASIIGEICPRLITQLPYSSPPCRAGHVDAKP